MCANFQPSRLDKTDSTWCIWSKQSLDHCLLIKRHDRIDVCINIRVKAMAYSKATTLRNLPSSSHRTQRAQWSISIGAVSDRATQNVLISPLCGQYSNIMQLPSWPAVNAHGEQMKGEPTTSPQGSPIHLHEWPKVMIAKSAESRPS